MGGLMGRMGEPLLSISAEPEGNIFRLLRFCIFFFSPATVPLLVIWHVPRPFHLRPIQIRVTPSGRDVGNMGESPIPPQGLLDSLCWPESINFTWCEVFWQQLNKSASNLKTVAGWGPPCLKALVLQWVTAGNKKHETNKIPKKKIYIAIKAWLVFCDGSYRYQKRGFTKHSTPSGKRYWPSRWLRLLFSRLW